MRFTFATLLKDKPKTPAEVVQKAVAAYNALDNATKEKQTEKALENVCKALGWMKMSIFGDEGHDPTIESVVALAVETGNQHLLPVMVRHMKDLDFETRKDAAQVFGALVRIKDQDSKSVGALYVRKHPEILEQLFRGYDDANIALNCGSMFRDCMRDESLASTEYHANQQFFEAYMKLLQSSNYVTRRQSLKLLGELLLDRTNVKVMVKFVSELSHLQQMMKLLKDHSRSIQFEAFHVFKVFVANPNKPPLVTETLVNNKEKLLKYLEEFHTDKDEDESFKEEKAVIIKEISMLSAPPRSSSPAPPPLQPGSPGTLARVPSGNAGELAASLNRTASGSSVGVPEGQEAMAAKMAHVQLGGSP